MIARSSIDKTAFVLYNGSQRARGILAPFPSNADRKGGSLMATKTVDMLHGGIAGKVLRFTLPLMFSGLLQALYSAADLLVIGQWAGDKALAAVGATVSVYSIIINLFMGLSVGVDVLASRAMGLGNRQDLRGIIDTAVLSSVLVGIPVALLGIGLTEPLLSLLNTPHANGVFEGAAQYMKICFLGTPFLMAFNFSSAILRTRGETRRPFLYLSLAGAVNVGLNLFFVAVCGLSVVGVALDTVISQLLSALLILIDLCRGKDEFHFSLRRARFSFRILGRMFRIGILVGLQNAIFGISNSFLQSGVNSLGDAAIAGSAAADKLEELIWVAVSSFQYAGVTFISQNAVARKYGRVKRIALSIVGMSVLSGVLFGGGLFLLREPVLSVFIPKDPAAMGYALDRACITYPLYFIASFMAVLPSVVQGLGYHSAPAMINVMGVCVLRVVWRFTVFPAFGTLVSLFSVFPVSWTVTSLSLFCAVLLSFRAVKRRYPPPADADSA